MMASVEFDIDHVATILRSYAIETGLIDEKVWKVWREIPLKIGDKIVIQPDGDELVILNLETKPEFWEKRHDRKA